MKVSVVVATCGSDEWRQMALRRAVPSAKALGPDQVIHLHLPQGNVAEARNKAVEMARGDWLCFLDADDELCDGYLDAMLRAALLIWHGDDALFEGERITYEFPLPSLLLVPAVCELDAEGEPIGRTEIPNWGRRLIDINCAVIGSLIPRALFLEVGGFDASLPIYEDWDLWLRCVGEAGAQLVPVPDAVYCAHVSLASSRNRQDQATREKWYSHIRSQHEWRFA